MTKQEKLAEQRFKKYFPKLRYFKAEEFLYMGGGNASGKCKGLNRVPPIHLHSKIYAVARVWDEIRHRLGKPINTLSIYRSPSYNRCVGGVANSQHKQGTATDAYSKRAKAKTIYRIALRLRKEGFFKGGIGLYVKKNFVHVDVRGANATWGAGR